MAEKISERFSRLLLMVPFVMQRPGVLVSEVCDRFGIDRAQLVQDLDLLMVCGLPGYGPGDLIEASIDGDEVNIRMADYFARPPRLTSAEGLLLLAGARALVAAGVADEHLNSAIEKLGSALGRDSFGRVSVGFDEPIQIQVLREALESRRRVHVKYLSQSKDEMTERDVDPWSVFGSSGRWYLVGWCHRVNDERIFRVDRMADVRVLEDRAEPPESLDLAKYRDVYVEGPEAIRVVLDLSPRAALWVPEYYPLQVREALDDGWVRVELSAGGTAWLVRVLLRLGKQARVVDPPELEDEVRDLACRLAAKYR